jgi:hypothetical protein
MKTYHKAAYQDNLQIQELKNPKTKKEKNQKKRKNPQKKNQKSQEKKQVTIFISKKS